MNKGAEENHDGNGKENATKKTGSVSRTMAMRMRYKLSSANQMTTFQVFREKRILNDATMLHKCINKLVPDYLADMFNYFPKYIIEKIDRRVLWTYPYVACQQSSALSLSEEPNSGIL